MTTVLADPARMIANGTPRVIHDEELEPYTSALFRLTILDNASRAQHEAIELLTLLIERYEEAHYPIPRTDAVSVVCFLLEHQDLTQRELVLEFGSESAVSMFLAGQRKLTLEQVRRLSALQTTRRRFCPDLNVGSSLVGSSVASQQGGATDPSARHRR